MPTPAKTKKKSKSARIFSGIFYGLICLGALAVGTGAGWMNKSPLMVKMAMAQVFHQDPKDVFNSKETTVLILGCDEDRYYGGKQILNHQARSDMMLLAKLDFEHNRVGAVSIPRDLWVDPPGYSGHKINAYHAIGGPDLSKYAVEYALDVKIDRVLVLNFEAFQEMIDLVGGIDIYVPKDMKYTDKAGGLFIDLEQGRHKLTGYQAMGFVRFRKSDSDFARAERQRDLMLAFKSAVAKNPAQLTAVVEKASEMLGGGFTDEELATLSVFMRGIKSDNIKMGAVPVVERSRSSYTLDVDRSKIDETLQEHYLRPAPLQSASSQSRTRNEL